MVNSATAMAISRPRSVHDDDSPAGGCIGVDIVDAHPRLVRSPASLGARLEQGFIHLHGGNETTSASAVGQFGSQARSLYLIVGHDLANQPSV